MLEQRPPSQVARVVWLSDDRREAYLQYRSGLAGTVSSTVGVPFEVEVGDVVVVSSTGMETAPSELWPSETWLGVVRALVPDAAESPTHALVAGRGDVRCAALNEIACGEGNTVEVDDSRGIVRKVSDRSISYLDREDLDATDLSRFKPPPPDPPLTFEDFGGLEAVKRRAAELVELPLERHAELAAIGARPIKGVLFTGDPGTGKTLLARIIASRADATFYEISGPQIFSKWLGESEAILRRVFDDAAEQERSIIFFDEIDSVAPQRAGEANDSSRRVVAQLLVQMDGFKSDANVIVIAATNRPDDLDAALRRPGRFDWEVEFPMPGPEDRLKILQVSSRRLTTADDLDHGGIVERTEGWSAAELAAIWSEAALLTVADNRKTILNEDYYGGLERVAEQRRRPSAENGKEA